MTPSQTSMMSQGEHDVLQPEQTFMRRVLSAEINEELIEIH